jgi:CheY-like chemotaxis protein
MKQPSPAGTVLVVEDDPIVRAFAVELFHDLGWRVVDAYNAANALKALEGDPAIDLMFIDVRMPGELNGLELAKQVRAVRPGLKIILTSGDRHGTEAFDFLPKPWNVRVLRDLLDRP